MLAEETFQGAHAQYFRERGGGFRATPCQAHRTILQDKLEGMWRIWGGGE